MDSRSLVELVRTLRRRGTDLPSVEVKACSVALPRSVRETLSAFSNDHGGVLILGLAEAGGFTPVAGFDAGRMRDNLSSTCSDEMEPPVRAEIEIEDFEGHQVVIATVPEMDPVSKPCYVKSRGLNGGSFTRGGDGDRALTGYEIFLLHSNRGQPRDDHQVIPDADVTSLDADAVSRLLRRVRSRDPRPFATVDDETALVRLGVLRETADGRRATLAGLLTLGQWPQQYVPQLFVSFIAVPATSKDAVPEDAPRFSDNATIRGTIPQMIEETVTVILRNARTAGRVSGLGREDVGDYPVEALREAVTNALGHRDYSTMAAGAQVQVELYLDRLVVRNPGGLFGAVTPDDLGQEGVSSSRNGYLMNLLADVYLPGTDQVVADNRGSGIPDMLARLRRANMTLPTFDSKLTRFTVTFPKHTLLTPETVKWIEGLGEPGLSQTQVTALALMRDGRTVSNGTLRQLGLDSRDATAALSDLVNRGLAYRVGGRRYAEYLLNDSRIESAEEPSLFGDVLTDAGKFDEVDVTPSRRRYDRTREVDSLFDTTEELSAAQVMKATGLGSGMVAKYLSRLITEGRIAATAPIGSRRRTYRRSSS